MIRLVNAASGQLGYFDLITEKMDDPMTERWTTP